MVIELERHQNPSTDINAKLQPAIVVATRNFITEPEYELLRVLLEIWDFRVVCVFAVPAPCVGAGTRARPF